MIIREIEEFKSMKPKILAYLGYIFSQNLSNLKDDITVKQLIQECKHISDEIVGYDRFYDLDGSGYQISEGLIFSSKPELSMQKGEDRSFRSYYREVVKQRGAYLSDPYPGSYNNKLFVTMAVPIFDSYKNLKFIVCCDILLGDVLKLTNPSSVDSLFGQASRLSYFLINSTLFLIAMVLFYFGAKSLIFTDFRLHDTSKILESTILLTLALALVDLTKAYFEEEILGWHEKNTTNSKTMIKFLSSIIIALAIEALMLVFKFSITFPEKIIYPVFLIAVIALLVIALGFYIYITKKAIREERES